MRIGLVEWPEGLDPKKFPWAEYRSLLARERIDLLITNELPFGPWVAAHQKTNKITIRESIELHRQGLSELVKLPVGAVLTSRPVAVDNLMLNEAILISPGGTSILHQKQIFPYELGWYETSWYKAGDIKFNIVEFGGVKIGCLLCTDLLFNEYSRQYGNAGVQLIAVPRATGMTSFLWRTAGSMAAIVSGAYVASSNRSGSSNKTPQFGGGSFAFAPDGTLIAETSRTSQLTVVEIDPLISDKQKHQYPCYLASPNNLHRT